MASAPTSASVPQDMPASGLVGAASLTAVQAASGGLQPVIVSSVAARIARIADGGPLDTSVVAVQLSQDVSDTLGNLGTNDDGMDNLLNDMASLIDTDSQGVVDAGSILNEITDTDYPTFEANTFTPIAGDLGTFQDAGDAIVAQFNTDIIPPPPAPTQPPADCTPTLANPFPCGFGPPTGNGPNPV